MLEVKTEVKTEDTEPDASDSKGEPGSAVGAIPGREQMRSTQICHSSVLRGDTTGPPWMTLLFALIPCLIMGSERIEVKNRVVIFRY